MFEDFKNILSPDELLFHAAGLGVSWDYIDQESGAFLERLSGRRKAGRPPRWIMIVPNRTVEQRGGLLTPYEWDHGDRKFFTGSISDVLPRANAALEKIIKLRSIHTVDNSSFSESLTEFIA